MYVYAGIDEAGYGPMFGPLLVGRMVLGVPHLNGRGEAEALEPFTGRQLWKRLNKAVCRDLTKRRGRIAVNDSKKLKTAKKYEESSPAEEEGEADEFGSDAMSQAVATAAPPVGRLSLKYIEHLERGVLAFAALAGHRTADVFQWLDCLGENCHHDLNGLPWYAHAPERPWATLPCSCTEGEIAVARNMLGSTARQVGLEVLDLGAAVVFEDRFNRMVAATRSKAAASFTFVAGHLRAIWDKFGHEHPNVVVDRQSGRTHYRELLAMNFPEAELAIIDERAEYSAYRLTEKTVSPRPPSPAGAAPQPEMPGVSGRSMTISFEVDSESQHMPVALASMVSKYTRELMMHRFQAWFLTHAPRIKPTAGYAQDARRFWNEIQPTLEQLSIAPGRLARSC